MHFEDDRLDALADVVRLAGDLFAARQQRLGLAEADRGGAALEAADRAVDEDAFFGLVLVEDGVAFLFAEALDENLLGGLGGDAAELLDGERLFALHGLHVAGLAVDGDDDAVLVVVALLNGEAHRLLDVAEDDFFGNVAFAGDEVHAPQQLAAVHAAPSR